VQVQCGVNSPHGSVKASQLLML